MKKTITKISNKKKKESKKLSIFNLFPDHRRSAFINKSTLIENSSIKELKNAYRNKGLVLYLGAGLSRSIGLPNWVELVRSLTVKMMSKKVESAIDALGKLDEDERWNVIYGLNDEPILNQPSEKPILMLARSLKDQFGADLSNEIGNVFYRRFYRSHPTVSLGKFRLSFKTQKTLELPLFRSSESSLVEAVAALTRAERDAKGDQAIINYNYDDLLEEYLKKQKIKCKTVLSGVDHVPDGVLPSYHVHGLISFSDYVNFRKTGKKLQSKGNFVFSEDEYHAEYSDPYRWSNMTQMSHLGRYTGLFIGLSMEDPNIRRLIDVTYRQFPETKNYAIITRKNSLKKSKNDKQLILRNLFEEVEVTSFRKIGVNVLWVDDFTEIPLLLNRIVEDEISEHL